MADQWRMSWQYSAHKRYIFNWDPSSQEPLESCGWWLWPCDVQFGKRYKFYLPSAATNPWMISKVPLSLTSPLPYFPGVSSCSPHCYPGHRVLHEDRTFHALFVPSPTLISVLSDIMSWWHHFWSAVFYFTQSVVIFPPESENLASAGFIVRPLLWSSHMGLVPSPVLHSSFPLTVILGYYFFRYLGTTS